MKVKELIEKLKNVDPERIIVMSKDAEGNDYSPLYDIDDEMVYVPDSTWSGEVRFPKLTTELIKQGYSEGDVYDGEDGQPALVLHPVN